MGCGSCFSRAVGIATSDFSINFQLFHNRGKNSVHFLQVLAQPFKLLKPTLLIQKVCVLTGISPASGLVLRIPPGERKSQRLLIYSFCFSIARNSFFAFGPSKYSSARISGSLLFVSEFHMEAIEQRCTPVRPMA